MDMTDLLTRRGAIRLIGGTALATLPLAMRSSDAQAARGWCMADPLLRIAGVDAHVYIASPEAMLRSATDKIRLLVALPRGVEGKLIDILSDFGEGYEVRFSTLPGVRASTGKIPVRLAVYCPARDSTLPVHVEFAPVGAGSLTAGSATGMANDWIIFRTG